MIDNIIVDKSKIAIVVVGYNKLKGLNRILSSINNAFYDESEVPLIISIDASNNQDVYTCAKDFNWKHGTKYVNIEKEKLGLKRHIYQCASFVYYFKGVIVLEDDLFVSPYFYHYAVSSLNKYETDINVAGIALYVNMFDGFHGIPFTPVRNQSDVFAWQSVCSWGEIWNERMWSDFTKWLDEWDENFEDIDMPKTIKEWTRSWSKYFYAYMIKRKKYFIFPYVSLTTNFNDEGGEHGDGDKSLVQVPLLCGHKQYQFDNFNNLVRYDVYGHNVEISKWIGVNEKELSVNLYGEVVCYKRYVLTPLKLPYKIIRRYSLSMRPWELNLWYAIEGNDLFLYDRGINDVIYSSKMIIPHSVKAYFLGQYRLKLLLQYVISELETRFKKTLFWL